MRPSELQALLALALLVGACSSPEPSADVPSEDGDILIAEDETLYQTSCAECNGTGLRGTDKGGIIERVNRFFLR